MEGNAMFDMKNLGRLKKLDENAPRNGSVALTSGGAAMPWLICRSGSNIEQLVDELDLALDVGLAQDAMASSDHAHDLEAFNGGVGGSHRLETASGTDHSFNPTMVCLNDVV
jgi:hypothetical protein